MDIKLENMSYQEFKKYCSDRACDGQWSMLEAMACLNVIEEIDKIKVKGLFLQDFLHIHSRIHFL